MRKKKPVKKSWIILKDWFFGIDGTLVSFQTHQIPESAINALAQLHEKGVLLYIASGRAPFQLPKEILHGTGAFKGFDGFLCNSGQICMDMRGVFRKAPLDPADVETIKANIDKHGFDLSVMTDSEIFVNRIGARVDDLQKSANVSFQQKDLSTLGDQPIYQMNAFVTEEEAPLVFEGTKHVKGVRWHPDFIDVIPAEGGKDVGIQAVLDHYGFGVDEAFAFGDGGNDSTMLVCNW